MVSDLLPIQPHGSIRTYAFKKNVKTFSLRFLLNGKFFTIPGVPELISTEQAPVSAVLIPVMWNIHRFPVVRFNKRRPLKTLITGRVVLVHNSLPVFIQ